MIFLCFIVLQFIGFQHIYARFQVSNELSANVASTTWMDKLSGNAIDICQKDSSTHCIGKQQSSTNIYWEQIYSLPFSTRLDIYIEFQVSGTWNNQNLEVYANNVLMKSIAITSIDQNRQCNTQYDLIFIRFPYESYIQFSLVSKMDTLKLTIKSNGINQGLFIQNIVINQQTQYGRNNIIPFVNYIKACTSGSGLEFVQYYCKCPSLQVFEVNQCKTACSQGYLYDPITNECYQKSNCNSCVGTNSVLQCDTGKFKYLESTSSSSNCVERCPGDYYADTLTESCIDMRSYLQQHENNGYPVDHSFFFKNTADFFHFFSINDFRIFIVSVPAKVKERPFVYRFGQFVAGSYETFQSQSLQLSVLVRYSQYKLRFRATGHFIDFMPTRNQMYINGVLQPQSTILQSSTNQQQSDQDYITYYDYYWTRTELYPVTYNNFLFEIEQPLQNGIYQGYFYLEDIHVYSFQCQTNCDSCFTVAYCTPCLNPAHKNPSDCTCEQGYTMKGDICVACPTYCTDCTVVGVCDDCLVSTKRLNPPNCDQCPEQYYLKAYQDNCQPCQNGCRICTTNTFCNNCLLGSYKNSDSQCVIQCSDGYFNDGTDTNNPICSLCNTNCLKCQNSATFCTACGGTATLVNNHCYSCQSGQYLSGTTCLSCIQNCEQCQGSICTKCNESYFMSSTGTCVAQCAQNQFGNIANRTCDLCEYTCETCLGGTSNDCVSCPPGRVLNLQNAISGQCQPNCLFGYFRLGDFCGKCWKGCASCTDATPACLVCASKYYRFKSNGLCYDLCPDGYYNNKMGYVCSVCNSNCKTCNGSTENNCKSCNLPLGLYQNQCVANCPDEFGNVNGVCEACTANCKQCFGKAANECAVCSQGFYFLKNQCYFKCPTSFVGVRPQYICKCVYDNCVACTAVQFFFNNHCYDECPDGSFGFNGLCVKCDISCNSCFGEDENNCLSCSSPLILFQNRCVTECTNRTFHEIIKNECQYCNDSCLACNGPDNNNCTACFDIQLLTEDGTCVDQCSDSEYPVLSEKKCYKCDPSCLTCFSGSKNSCLTCSNLFYLYQCVDSCPDGFKISTNLISCEPDFAIVIDKCSYQCTTCELVPRFCKGCSGNRIPNPPNCDCDNGHYDDGSSENCQPCVNKCSTCSLHADFCITCKGDRLLPQCTCPKYYYDDMQSVNCIRCPDNCASCNASGCITCLNNRITPPDCICPDGYFESFAPYCLECSKKCLTCSITEQLCGSCSDIRENPPICNCPDGYFENSNEECQKCNPTCIDCNLSGCLSCFGNRVGPVAGQCICNTPGVSRLGVGSVYCTDCQTGVPIFGLNSDFTGFFYDFGAQVTVIFDESNNDLCSQVFTESTLSLLGINPQCDIFFNVLFGENTTIKVGDMIQLKPQFLMLGCKEKFEQVKEMPLQIPQTISPSTRVPLIKFKELLNPNVCSPLSIEFDKKLYNGMQQFMILSWSMILPTQNNPTIDAILQANVANNSEVIMFPMKTLEPNTIYKFSLSIKSFAQLTNTLTVEFQTVAYSTIIFKPETNQNQFHRYDAITIPFTIKYYNCIEQNPPSQILFYQIKLVNKLLLNGNITEGLIDGYKQDLLLQFDSYYFNFSNPYTLVFSTQLTRSDYKVQTSDTFDIFIIASTPILTIEGGNRMIGYDTNLYLNATIKDQDYTQEEANEMDYTCYWSCTDIVNGTNCQDQFGQILVFDNNCKQVIKGKTFAPYQVFFFSVSINKNQVSYSTRISIQIIELDLPSLNITGVDQSQVYNYYDEFIYKLDYPGVNPDLLMYSGAVIYNQIAQSTFQFYYLDLKFKLQNYFTNLTQQFGTKVRLRLSIYDPRFVMPSINTQILSMNMPPQFCELKFDDITNFVEFLDEITLSIIGCYDDNQPLLYSIQMYPNRSIYESDLIQSNFYHYLLIEPPQQQNKFKFTLPNLNKQESLLVVLIQDSIGGITNLTTYINVKKFENINEDNFIEYQQKQISLNQQLVGYRLLTERLFQIVNLQNYKQNLFEKLITLDQNQTFQSNQTESLYHSISILVGQNCSLLQINQTQFLSQLNYRISIASQTLTNLNQIQVSNQMTSEQNIQKVNFIQQQYTFANILSSSIKFRVAFNISATDILDQLNNIIVKLQGISVANEPLYKINTDSANLNFGYLTSKIVEEATGTKVLGKQLDESDNKQDINSSTTFYKYSQTRYLDNPYYSAEGFPKNSSGYQAVDPKMETEDKQSNNQTLSSPMNFQFPNVKELAANTSLKCIAKMDSKEWSAGVCKTVQSQGQVVCQCNTLNPTSIMESLDLILDKAAQIYSLDTLLAFASFPFYETIVFYFYLTITGSYITIIYWGMKVDNVMYSKLQDEVERLNDDEGNPSKENPLENQNEDPDDQKNNQEEVILKRTIFKKHSTRILKIVHLNNELEQENQVPQDKSLRDQVVEIQQNHPNFVSQFTTSPKIICDDFPLMKLSSPRGQQIADNLQSEQLKAPTQYEQKITKLKAYVEYLKFFHQILSVIYKYDEKQPRALRATIVYTSIMGSLAVLFVFNQPNNLSLTIALALITAPLNKIYQIVLEKLLTNKKKLIRSIGGVLMVSVAGFISYTMLAGLVLSGSVETANKWSYIFIGTFSLDNIIYSPIQLILQYCVHLGLIKFPTLQKLLHKFLDEKGKQFLKEIFVKTGLV